MKDKLMNYHPRALRKYISEYNKQQRAEISEKIKEKRKEFSEKMKAERKGQKMIREIKIPKGIKKEGLVKLVMSRASMKIKAENDFKNKTAFEGFEFKGDVLQPQGLKAKKEKPAPAKKDTAKQPAPKPKPAPKKEEPEKPKDKLIQFSESDTLDRRTLFNHKIINGINEERLKAGKPQIKSVSAYLKEVEANRKKEAAEKRARTRAKNEAKKLEQVKKTSGNMTKDEFINNFMKAKITDLGGIVGEETLKNILKIINASSTKPGKYQTLYVLDLFKPIGADLAEKLIDKYGFEKTTERIKKMILDINPNKKVQIPESQQELTKISPFTSKFQNKIRDALPFGIEKGKVYKTFEEWNNRNDKKKKEAPKPAPAKKAPAPKEPAPAKKEEPKPTPAKKPNLKELEKLMIDLRKSQIKRSSEFDKVNKKFEGNTSGNPVYNREFDAVPIRIEKEQAKLFDIASKYPIGKSFGKPKYLINKKGVIGQQASSILFDNVSKDLKSANTEWFISPEEQERRKKKSDEEARRRGKIAQDEENRQKDYMKKIYKEFPKMEKEIVSVLKKKLTKGKENKELKQVREKYVKLQQKYRKETKAENIQDPIESLSRRIVKAYKNKNFGGIQIFGLDFRFNPDKIKI